MITKITLSNNKTESFNNFKVLKKTFNPKFLWEVKGFKIQES